VNLDIEIWLLTDSRYLQQRMPAVLARWLAEEGNPPALVVADRGEQVNGRWEALSPGLPPWSDLREGDLVVARSRHPRALALLERAEAFGARPLDRRAAIEEVRDKARCAAALARRGLPTPETFLVRRPADLSEVAADAFPLLLKPVLGDNGDGLVLVRRPDELADVEWPDEVVLAQSYVDARGIDLKVYVAGDAIWAVRRPSPLTDADDVPQPAELTPRVRELAEACRQEFGLVLFGLDVLELADGSLAIVDVNEFPNYTGVDEAPATIGRLVLAEAARAPRGTTRELVGRT
jgi:ribosomal protein S6--L-glutamate ligase